MDKATLVAINLSYNGKIANNSLVPILFYWDGNGTLLENMLNDKPFRKLIFDKVVNKEAYTSARLDWFYFTYNEDGNNTENYTEDSVNIQELLPFKDIDNVILWEEYAGVIFKDLYKLVKKEDPKETNIDEYYIAALYHDIKGKNPIKIRKATVLEYVRSQLKERFGLSQENADYIYDKLNIIIVDNGS